MPGPECYSGRFERIRLAVSASCSTETRARARRRASPSGSCEAPLLRPAPSNVASWGGPIPQSLPFCRGTTWKWKCGVSCPLKTPLFWNVSIPRGRYVLTSASATLLADVMTAPHSWSERSSSVATCRRVMTQHWPTSNCDGLITVIVCSLSSMIFHPSSRPATQRSHGSLMGSSIICPLLSIRFAPYGLMPESSRAVKRRRLD